MAHHPEARTDGAIEKAVRAVIRFILAVLFAFILGTSYFLSRFIIGRILMPLKELERGQRKCGREIWRCSWITTEMMNSPLPLKHLMSWPGG